MKRDEDARARLVSAYAQILNVVLGADRARAAGVARTPQRCADALLHLTSGYAENPSDIAAGAIFRDHTSDDDGEPTHTGDDNEPREMSAGVPHTPSGLVLVADIPVHSLCEHHLLPFFGCAHVAYVPGDRGCVLGLSKIPRIVDAFARRLQIQERLARQVAEALLSVCAARGTAVSISARHLCMEMRGVAKHAARTQTVVLLGAFQTDESLRDQFLASISAQRTT